MSVERTLHHFPLDPASRQVRLAMGEKRLPFVEVQERYWERRESLVALNPSGLTPVLVETRTLIDEIDRDIRGLLAQRAELGRRAGAEKERIGRAIRDRGREDALLAERRAWAEERSLDGDAVASVFDAIMSLSRRVQGA